MMTGARVAEKTAIEWTDATVNFWWGCSKVSLGCEHCYAEAWAKRVGEHVFGVGVPRRKVKSAWTTLRKLHHEAPKFSQFHGRRRRVFLQSMSDLFDKEVPDEWFDEAWGGVTFAHAVDIQIVTKRVSYVEKRLDGREWPQHAGLIISVINQDEADRDIPRLIDLKAHLGIPWIGLSMEPLLGAVVLKPEWLAALDWVIVGGESGTHARPMHPDWVISLRDQCGAAGVPFMFKQWGEWLPVGEWYESHPVSLPLKVWHSGAWRNDDGGLTGEWMAKIGKKTAGRLLWGVEHNGFPL